MRRGRRLPRGVAACVRDLELGHAPKNIARRRRMPEGFVHRLAHRLAMKRLLASTVGVTAIEWALICAVCALIAAPTFLPIADGYTALMSWAIGSLSPSQSCTVPPDDGHANATRLIC